MNCISTRKDVKLREWSFKKCLELNVSIAKKFNSLQKSVQNAKLNLDSIPALNVGSMKIILKR